MLGADMQRRAQIGLNKGEAHHALKNALRIGRQGEIRDRTAEGQHYRMAGLNLSPPSSSTGTPGSSVRQWPRGSGPGWIASPIYWRISPHSDRPTSC
jgi:hypothetical protein